MEITYLGHSCFKIKGKQGTVVCDPYDATVGFSLPNVSADIVTVSHDHFDHNASGRISGTARRKKPFVISKPGEYEIGGISIFGIQVDHDASGGTLRGHSIIYTMLVDQVRVCHLGDLGHELTATQKSDIGAIDVLLIPVGGHSTINPEQAVKVLTELDPSYVIPMHYKTEDHHPETFADLLPLQEFLNEYGITKKPAKSLEVEMTKLPEETEVVVLERV